MMQDLFGNNSEKTVKTFRQRYEQYIRSARWRKKARRAIEMSGHTCQRCGAPRWLAKLEVHHITYERFENELPQDLEVVCVTCHKRADEDRLRAGRKAREEKIWRERLDGWASKVWGENWRETVGEEYACDQFADWLWRRGEA